MGRAGMSARVVKMKFNERSWTKKFTAEMLKLVKDAAREYLKLLIERVPVYTGMSQGSLKPLSRFLNHSFSISPKHFRRDRTPALGERQQDFKLEAQHGGKTFRFRWNTHVAWFIANNYHAHPNVPSAPWGVLEDAEDVFYQYLKDNWKDRMPRLKSFMIGETKHVR